MIRVTELDYVPDSSLRFRSLLARPWCVFLDSAGGSSGGRFDIMTADPYVTLTTRGGETEVRSRRGHEVSSRHPLQILREHLGEREEPGGDLPFSGGAVGYLGYDLARRFMKLPTLAAKDIDMPELAVGLYDWAVIVDHLERRSWLVGRGRDERTFDEWDARLTDLTSPTSESRHDFRVLSPVSSNLDRDEYGSAFRRVKEHIRLGDCYQVNLTRRFKVRVEGNPWRAYLRLRRINPAPFSAFLGFPDGCVLSSSPERFLEVRDGRVETRPIKGTRPRAAEPARDRALAAQLHASSKDRAENVMIVDLLRNDLGKVCVPGSIRVPELFRVESFANVHHLVSTVEGRLEPGKDALELLAGCFPGGSITGAPKQRAMEIIEQVEPHRRSVYCGSIGYVGFDGSMDSNIAIRTLVQSRGWVYAWAGGAVVADSEAQAEYDEGLDKVAALLAVLNDTKTSRASSRA